ncbi:MAG: hypothetical protein NHB14_27190 [Desulfosporosinus sp.]|nr:hypothetical protein [Desulfosporosinus sp.]
MEENKRTIERLRNPSPEEREKYTDAYFNDLIDALEKGVHSYETMLEMLIDKPQGKPKGRPKKTDEPHRLIPRMATITVKEYATALSPNISGHAYLAVLDEEFFKQTGFDENNGALIVKDHPGDQDTLTSLRTSKDIKSLDYTLLRSIYTIIYQQKEDVLAPGTYVIDEMELARFLGIQINKEMPIHC